MGMLIEGAFGAEVAVFCLPRTNGTLWGLEGEVLLVEHEEISLRSRNGRLCSCPWW